MTTIAFRGPLVPGDRQLAVDLVDWLRKRNLSVVSLYEAPEKLPSGAAEILERKIKEADIVVECY